MGREEAGLKAAGRAVPGLRELLVAWSPAAGVPWGSWRRCPGEKLPALPRPCAVLCLAWARYPCASWVHTPEELQS